MKKLETVELIKGKFDPKDASEILLTIIGDKIKFNNRQIFSREERNLGNTAHYKKRVEELKEAETRLLNFIKMAVAEEKELEIYATIEIKY
jgi:hypothetical protein